MVSGKVPVLSPFEKTTVKMNSSKKLKGGDEYLINVIVDGGDLEHEILEIVVKNEDNINFR